MTTSHGSGGDDESLKKHQEFVQVIKRGAEFSEELLRENERLRLRISDLEIQLGRTGRSEEIVVQELIERVRALEADRQQLAQQFSLVESENKNFGERCTQVEAENNNLLNIYVASYQLHCSLDFTEVLRTIREIMVNLVGAEVFNVSLVDERSRELKPLIVEGLLPQEVGRQMLSGVIANSLETGAPYFVDNITIAPAGIADPLICIPLRIKDQVIGCICIYRFLSHKQRLLSVDHELFTLLAGHAATAIFASKLYTESKRKLNNIQGFIDLVTS